MSSASGGRSRPRMLVVGLCLIALAGCGEDLGPTSWKGKSQFCDRTELLGVGEPQVDRSERRDVLSAMARSAPEDLRKELEAISEDPRQVDQETTDRIGRFIEDRCDVNPPGVKTDP